MSVPTAAWPANDLLDSYARHGGAAFDPSDVGAYRVLDALVRLLPRGSAEGMATAAQVADAAHMSVRWARRCLHVLEDMGLITWRRGGVVEGKPRPGWIRIIKTNLARLFRRSRDAAAQRRAERAQQTPARLAKLRSTYVRHGRPQQTPKSSHAELSSPLPFLKGRPRHAGATQPPPQLPIGDEMTRQNAGTPCRTCNHLPERCAHANSLVPIDQRHEYDPMPPRSHQLIAPLPRRHSEHRGQAPAGWRRPAHHQDTLIGDTNGH